MRSAIQLDDRACLVCGSEVTEEHHIFFGANRKQSERWGLKVYLCPEHHRGQNGVHHNRAFDLELKKQAQLVFEEDLGTHAEFMKIFGRNYL